MTLTRREFVELGLVSTIGGSTLLTLEGCNATDVWHQIETWVPVGIDAFDSILAIVDPLMAPGAAAIALLVKAGFASLASAIDGYLNAPASEKTTWAAKVKLILSQLGTDLQSFLSAVNLSGNPIVKVVVALVQVIVDTIAGFLGKVVPAAASSFPQTFRVGRETIHVEPMLRDRKKFVAAFNNACVANGHSELQIPRTP
jgi:hypothetical protein